jgi:hypothetical protein
MALIDLYTWDFWELFLIFFDAKNGSLCIHFHTVAQDALSNFSKRSESLSLYLS